MGTEHLKQFRFKKGENGNSGGRPKMLPFVRQRCRDMTPKILDKLEALLDCEMPSVAVSSAKLILAYGWGQPEAKLTVEDVTERPTEGLTREQLVAIASMPIPDEPEESESVSDAQH